MWLSRYALMTKETFVPFSEFYKKQTEPVKHETSEEILTKVFNIIKSTP